MSKNTETARRYATALFEIAVEEDCLEQTGAALTNIAALFGAGAKLAAIMRAPASADDKQAVLTDICRLLQAPDPVRRFVAIVARDGRASALPEMAQAWTTLLDKHQGAREIAVRTAFPLDDEHKQRIDAMLASTLDGGLRTVYECAAGLIGGAQIRIGSRLIDVSLRGGLDALQHNLKGI